MASIGYRKRPIVNGLRPQLARRQLDAYASGHRTDILEGRFVIDVRHAGRPWEVIVEPDEVRKLLGVLTAYPVKQP